ncbi:MAG TPA: hypothetical protein VHN16_17940 [Streptosporangiaceae bacterium]|nr:hypothetical protein [Streptosporangiaceae bacterium]
MAANPAPGAEYFTVPRHPNQRRYEALRAYFTEGLTVEQAGARAGYTRSSMASLLRDFRAGELELFAPPGRPGPKTAPAKDRARARALELRRAGLSVHEISARLRAEGTPLNLPADLHRDPPEVLPQQPGPVADQQLSSRLRRKPALRPRAHRSGTIFEVGSVSGHPCTGARTRCWKSTTSRPGPSGPARY